VPTTCGVSLIAALLVSGGTLLSEAPPLAPLDHLRALLDKEPLGKAAPQAQALLAEVETAAGRDSLPVADALDLVVEHWRGKGIDAPAIRSMAERAVALRERLQGPSSLPVAGSLRLLAGLYEWDDRLEEARAPFERALAIEEAALGPDHPDVARTLTAYATLLWTIDDGPESRPLCERAVSIVERNLGPNDIALADCLRILAGHLTAAGDHAASRDLAARRVAVLEAHYGRRHSAVASALLSLSNRTAKLGQFEETESLLLEALSINEGLGAGTDAIHLNLGAVYLDMGDYGRARQEYETSVALMEKKYPPGHRTLAFARNNLGHMLSLLGDDAGARRLVEDSLAVFERVYGKDSVQVADVLIELSNVLRELNDHDGARATVDRALAILEATPQQERYLSKALLQRGHLQEDENDLQGAKQSLERALKAAREHYGPGNLYLVDFATDLADMLVRLGDFEAARPLFDEAVQIEERVAGPDHPSSLRTLVSVASLALREGRRGDALRDASRAADMLNAFVRENVAYMPERQAVSMIEARDHPEMILAAGLLDGRDDAAAWRDALWRWTIARRGVVLDELAARNRAALRNASTETRAAWDRLARTRRRLAAIWIAGPDRMGQEGYTALLDGARAEKEQAELALARVSREYREARDGRDATPARVAAAIPPRSVLVEIVRVEAGHPIDPGRVRHDIALVLRPDGSSAHADLGSSDAIDVLVARWRDALAEALRDIQAGKPLPEGPGQTGRALRAAVWDPIARLAGGAATVYLVPEGALHLVDLAALPAPGRGYLIESGPAIRLLTTSRDVLRAPDAAAGSPAAHGVLALGAPDFDAAGTTRVAAGAAASPDLVFRGASPECVLRGTTWAALPASGREVRKIDALWRKREPVVVLTGGDASEERFKRDSRGKRVLHLATHAYFVHDRCEGATGDPLWNPLLLSGLVLAGANRGGPATPGGEDGLLTAEEMAALDLRGVDLAVLSGCDTGRGEVAVGEGVFGLHRALAIAGVQSVVMSLWPVPDRTTARWMSDFYAARTGGADAQDAARRAALGALERLRASGGPEHPYYWAGFTATGGAPPGRQAP
jgi:CHAT domain-containing protein/tetratricopeptide (TPR) repeat protein